MLTEKIRLLNCSSLHFCLVFSIPTLPKPAHKRKKPIEIVASTSYSAPTFLRGVETGLAIYWYLNTEHRRCFLFKDFSQVQTRNNVKFTPVICISL